MEVTVTVTVARDYGHGHGHGHGIFILAMHPDRGGVLSEMVMLSGYGTKPQESRSRHMSVALMMSALLPMF
jgi:hypothetical protein